MCNLYGEYRKFYACLKKLMHELNKHKKLYTCYNVTCYKTCKYKKFYICLFALKKVEVRKQSFYLHQINLRKIWMQLTNLENSQNFYLRANTKLSCKFNIDSTFFFAKKVVISFLHSEKVILLFELRPEFSLECLLTFYMPNFDPLIHPDWR